MWEGISLQWGPCYLKTFRKLVHTLLSHLMLYDKSSAGRVKGQFRGKLRVVTSFCCTQSKRLFCYKNLGLSSTIPSSFPFSRFPLAVDEVLWDVLLWFYRAFLRRVSVPPYVIPLLTANKDMLRDMIDILLLWCSSIIGWLPQLFARSRGVGVGGVWWRQLFFVVDNRVSCFVLLGANGVWHQCVVLGVPSWSVSTVWDVIEMRQ